MKTGHRKLQIGPPAGVNPHGSSQSEAAERIETIHWVGHVAMLSMSRYRHILLDPAAFAAAYPNVQFENPTITHSVAERGVVLTTTKRELLAEPNYDLFKAWQVVLAIAGMTAVLDRYLRSVAEQLTGVALRGAGVLDRFQKATGIRLTTFAEFERLRHFYEVRNISLHNLGRVNQRFTDRTANPQHPGGPYVFFPQDITEYRDVLLSFLSFVESQVPPTVG